MLRGHYPNERGTEIGPDIPQFCNKILKFTAAPYTISDKLCSFNIDKVPIGWVQRIDLRKFSSKIQQRVALGAPGYRCMTPFLYYEPRKTATDEAKECAAWVKRLAMKPADWAIFSATRSALIFERFKSLNKGLNNLMLECFTDAQFTEMLSPNVKLIVEKPNRDPRADHWKTWVAHGDIQLNDPLLHAATYLPAPANP